MIESWTKHCGAVWTVWNVCVCVFEHKNLSCLFTKGVIPCNFIPTETLLRQGSNTALKLNSTCTVICADVWVCVMWVTVKWVETLHKVPGKTAEWRSCYKDMEAATISRKVFSLHLHSMSAFAQITEGAVVCMPGQQLVVEVCIDTPSKLPKLFTLLLLNPQQPQINEIQLWIDSKIRLQTLTFASTDCRQTPHGSSALQSV